MEIIVNNVVENDDGSCDVDIQYDNEALEEAKKWYNETVPEEDREDIEEELLMQNFIISMMEDHIKDEEKAIDADK